jgi:pimeloyl-ACP methyl ester carboxylesterase
MLGAAATGVGLGAASRWSRLNRRRRSECEQPDPVDFGRLPEGTSWSVIADDGVRLSAEVVEPADGRTAEVSVVLVHGFALDRRCWHFQRRMLAGLDSPAARVVLYDHRSHGRSERARRPSCTIGQLGEDLDTVIRTLAPDGPLVLVGHSMGGMTIMALADHHPELFGERVAAVALLSTSAGEFASSGLPGTLLSRRNPLLRTVGALATWQPRAVERARRLINDVVWGVTRAYAYGDRKVAGWLVDAVHAMISANAVDALIDFVDTLNTHDRIAALPALATCDALILTGDADRIIPARHSRVIAAELPDARLVRLPGVGHMVILEHPDEVNDALARLVAEAAESGQAEERRRA